MDETLDRTRVRLKVFERDEWTCRACGDKDSTLAVHHLYYQDGDPWDDPLDALLTLCETCHQFEYEQRPKVEQALLQELRRRGVLVSGLKNFLAKLDELH